MDGGTKIIVHYEQKWEHECLYSPEIQDIYEKFQAHLQKARVPHNNLVKPATPDVGMDIEAIPLKEWALVDKFGWTFRTTGIITEDQVKRTLEDLGPANVKALWDWLNQWADKLKELPELENICLDYRMQFVAMGEDNFKTTLNYPSFADFLLTEVQPLDLDDLQKRHQ